MKNGIIFLEPVFKQQIWGGHRLATDWGYRIPGDNTGECWAIAAHPNGDDMIISGENTGCTLSNLWKKHPELFNNIDAEGHLVYDRFPLMVKIIDSENDLSIQVHPDDNYAKANENGSLGKTECWYVLDAPADAKLVVGHNAQTKEELKSMIEEKRWNELIREIPVKKGDFIQINPGTIHAIKGGIQILEIQQNSDVTYRVYDYDRLTDGKPRQLHIKQSIDVINVPDASDEQSIKHMQTLPKNVMNELIICDQYKVWDVEVDGYMRFDMDKPFFLVSVIDGEGIVRVTGESKETSSVQIRRGDHFIIPATVNMVSLAGNMKIIASTV